MIRAVIFDLGNVLLHFDHSLIARKLTAYPGFASMGMRANGSFKTLVREFEKGEIVPSEFLEESRRILRWDGVCSEEHFLDAWNTIFWKNDALIAELPKLARRATLVMLSNTNAFHADYARRTFPDVFRPFSELVFSYQVKAVKPEAAIFNEAVRRADVPADECMFFDDIMEHVRAANAAGIHGYQYVSVDSVKDVLAYHGM